MDDFIWEIVTKSHEIKEAFKGENRIYPYSVTRESPAAPYVVWTNVAETPNYGVNHKPISSKHRVQFDIYARNGNEAKKLGEILEKAFDGKGIAVLRIGPLPEYGTKLYRRTIDMSFIAKGN